MKLRDTLDRVIDRVPGARTGMAVFTRTRELNGNYAANAVTLIGFIALFPLMLVIISVAGLLTGPNPHLADRLVDFLGLSGNAANTVVDTLDRARRAGATGSIIGFVGMAWSGLSLVGALQFAVNLPHGHGISGIRARALGIPWLAGSAVIFTVSVTISAILNWIPVWTAPLAIAVGFGIDVALFVWTFWFLDIERPPPRHLLPGAIATAAGFAVLKTAATLVLPGLVRNSSATYGTLGTVFAILAWLLIFSRVFVYSIVLNSVWADRDRTGQDDSTRRNTRSEPTARSSTNRPDDSAR